MASFPGSQWCTDATLISALNELRQLQSHQLPGQESPAEKWLALAFRRDLLALGKEKPEHGLFEHVQHRPNPAEFDKALTCTIKRLERRCAEAATGIWLNQMFGPWEGGKPAEDPVETSTRNYIPFSLVFWNVQGALAVPSGGTITDKVLKLCSALHQFQASCAVISDPQLAPGVQWPPWTGFQFEGERTLKPDSVAILTAAEASKSVTSLADFGDARACWANVTLRRQDGADPIVVLLLGVYALPPNHLESERRQFWHTRLQEYRKIKQSPQYLDAPLILVGDLNLHIPQVSSKDARLARPIDREILCLLTSENGFNLVRVVGAQIPTHVSGTSLDFAFVSPGLQASITIQPFDDTLLSSDHACCCLTVSSLQLEVMHTQSTGTSRWIQGENWETALELVSKSLFFVAGWACAIANCPNIRNLAMSGKQKRLRQKLLDQCVWWRSALYTIAGHLFGLVKATKQNFSGTAHAAKTASQIKEFFRMLQNSDETSGWNMEDLCEEIDFVFSFKKLSLLQELTQQDWPQAQKLLSTMLRPKVALQLNLPKAESGETLGPAESLELIADNIRQRAIQAHPGSTGFNRMVDDAVQNCRKKAFNQVAEDHGEFVSWESVVAIQKQLQPSKASARFPRSVCRFGGEPGTAMNWALLNLIGRLTTLPSCWFREITPLRKRGPLIVDDVSNLRPVTYTDDLESLFDAAWLLRNQAKLEQYIGPHQHGGRIDAVLVALSIITVAQLRQTCKLPTLILKQDLLQGFDLTWRSGTLVHLWEAKVQGRDWLLQDSSFSSDKLRIRVGSLIGPIEPLSTFAVGQGKRTAVHLFEALSKGLTNEIVRSCVGVSLDGPVHSLTNTCENSTSPKR